MPDILHVAERPGPVDLEIGLIYTHERQWMPRLLPELAAAAGDVRTRLLLVDNASTDGAAQWIPYFPRVQVLHNERRLHYAANLNVILKAARAPLVLLLNTDVAFAPHVECLARMVDFMRAHPRCGVAGCAVLRPDESFAYPARRFQTLPIIAARRLGLSWLLRGTIDRYLYKDRDAAGVWPCQWLSGCFLMVRREAIDDVGGFDEGFSKYFEDVDICLRMSRGGWDVMYNGRTWFYHLEQRASARMFSGDAWRHLRSYFRWLQKWGFNPDPTPVYRPERRRAA